MTDKTLTENAQIVLAEFERVTNATARKPVWSQGDVAHYAKLGPAATSRALADLLETGQLVSLREDRIEKTDLLYGVYSVRARATYYMTPERLQELKDARDVRTRKPYLEQARENILARYADEVTAEFERLWENRNEGN